MAGELLIHVICKSDLRTGSYLRHWEDPEQLAPMSPGKQEALLENPLSRHDTDVVQLIGTYGNRVIGRVDLIRGELVVEGCPTPVYYGSSLFVPENFRSTGMGFTLFRRMQAMAPTVAVCGISQMVYPLYQCFHWVDFELPRYILILRSFPVVERYLGCGLHSQVVSLGVDAGLAIHRVLALSTHRRLRGLEVAQAVAADEGLNQLLAQDPPAAGGHRSAAWLNWVLQHTFRNDPRDRQGLYLVRDRVGEVVGYFLLKVRFYAVASQHHLKNLLLGSLQDWLIFDPARLTFRQLLIQAVGILCNAGVHAVEVCGPDPTGSMSLRALGFLRVGSLRFLFKPNAGSLLTDRRFHQQIAWRLRPAEGDNFFT